VFWPDGSGMKLTGLLYFPTTTVRFQGNPGATCTLLIASRVGTKEAPASRPRIAPAQGSAAGRRSTLPSSSNEIVVRRDRETGRRLRLCALCSACCGGSVAAEFAVMAPILLLIIGAMADFGSVIRQSAALAGATRIGAEYARFHPADLTGIKGTMQNSMSFSPPLSFPANFSKAAKCDERDRHRLQPVVCNGRPSRPQPRLNADQCTSGRGTARILAGASEFSEFDDRDTPAVIDARPPRYFTDQGATAVEASIILSALLLLIIGSNRVRARLVDRKHDAARCSGGRSLWR